MARITIKHIARECGYSTMTVSCALRNDPKVRADTSAKILAVAERLGYCPDPELSKLMTYLRRPDRLSNAHRIAFINPYARKDYFSKAGYEHLVYEGMMQRAIQQGYKVEDFWLAQKGMNAKRLSSIIKSRGIEAILLPPWPKIGAQESFSWKDFAIAGTSESFWKPSVHRVVPNALHNMGLMLYRVRWLRYQHIGIVIPRDLDRRLHSTPGMVAEWLINHKLKRCKVSSYMGDLARKGEFEDWLRTVRPEVVVSFEPRPYQRILEMGLSVPGDIGFACHDVSVLNQSGRYSVSGINPRPEKIGAAAVDLLVGQLARNERGIPDNARVVMLEGDWVPGSTLRRQER